MVIFHRLHLMFLSGTFLFTHCDAYHRVPEEVEIDQSGKLYFVFNKPHSIRGMLLQKIGGKGEPAYVDVWRFYCDNPSYTLEAGERIPLGQVPSGCEQITPAPDVKVDESVLEVGGAYQASPFIPDLASGCGGTIIDSGDFVYQPGTTYPPEAPPRP